MHSEPERDGRVLTGGERPYSMVWSAVMHLISECEHTPATFPKKVFFELGRLSGALKSLWRDGEGRLTERHEPSGYLRQCD